MVRPSTGATSAAAKAPPPAPTRTEISAISAAPSETAPQQTASSRTSSAPGIGTTRERSAASATASTPMASDQIAARSLLIVGLRGRLCWSARVPMQIVQRIARHSNIRLNRLTPRHVSEPRNIERVCRGEPELRRTHHAFCASMYFVDVRRRGRAEDAVRVRPDLLRRHAHVAPSGDPADATTLPQGAGLPYLRKRGVCESLGDSPLTGVAAAAEPQSKIGLAARDGTSGRRRVVTRTAQRREPVGDFEPEGSNQ